MPDYKPEFDMPGYCAYCHDQIADFEGSHPNGIPIIKKFRPNFSMKASLFTLNNGSNLVVTLCNNCIDLPQEEYGNVLKSVQLGWNEQLNRSIIPHSDESKKKTIDQFVNLEIVDRGDRELSSEQKSRITNDSSQIKSILGVEDKEIEEII